MSKLRLLLLLLLVGIVSPAMAQHSGQDTGKDNADKYLKPDSILFNYKLAVTHHSITLDGKSIAYTATTGYMPIIDEKNHHEANIFFIAYTKDNVDNKAKRPVTFLFNGGPGSSSVWLHMGAIGPKKVQLTEGGNAVAPPYKMIDNDYSWLDLTDLVFIDPVGTGYSRPSDTEKQSEFSGYENDIHSVGDFIRLYTTKYERWESPKFLAGESYGTTRAAGLSGYLQGKGIYLNGIALLSSVLNFQNIDFNVGNEMPYILFLPTYTATAWYHHKLPADLQQLPLDSVLHKAQNFALHDYSQALMEGDQIDPTQKEKVEKELAAYTGLSESYVKETNMRINIFRFTKQLLRDQRLTVGRYDSRITGTDRDAAGETFEYDPSYDLSTYGPFTAVFNQYIRENLQYKNDLDYQILSGSVYPWNYDVAKNRYLNVAETLRGTMNRNPFMKVWVGCGYYDLATPYFSAMFTMNHMQLPPDLKKNITIDFFQSGHMVYTNHPSLVKFKKDITKFYQEELQPDSLSNQH